MLKTGRGGCALLLDYQLFIAEALAYCLAVMGGFETQVRRSVDLGQELQRVSPVVVVIPSDEHHDTDSAQTMLSQHNLRGKTLVTAADIEPAKWWKLRESGIGGIFLFSQPLEDFVRAAEDVASGKRWFPAEPIAPPHRARRLSEQESRMANMVAQGLSNKEIATQLNISESCVRGTIGRVFLKTGVQSRVQLARMLLTRSQKDAV